MQSSCLGWLLLFQTPTSIYVVFENASSPWTLAVTWVYCWLTRDQTDVTTRSPGEYLTGCRAKQISLFLHSCFDNTHKSRMKFEDKHCPTKCHGEKIYQVHCRCFFHQQPIKPQCCITIPLHIWARDHFLCSGLPAPFDDPVTPKPNA